MCSLSKLFQLCAYEIKYKTIGNNVNYAFVEKNNRLYIFFQGSHEKIDWWRNFFFAKKVYKQFRVHRGFFKAYSEVRNTMLDKAYSKDYEAIIVVGYSHGGALCQIAFEDIKYHFPNKDVYGYAFESPRCLKVPKKLEHLWNGLFVIRTNNDLITHLPPLLFGYKHQGVLLEIKGDTLLVKNHVPKCIKSHFPQVVLNGLLEWEKE